MKTRRRLTTMAGQVITKSIAVVGIIALGVAANANPLVLDWDTLTWLPEGNTNLTEAYSVGGVDVVVTIGGNTAGLDQDPPFLSPRVDDLNTGGLLPAENSLVIATDYADMTDDRAVTISVDFAAYAGGVTDVSFSIFDVDFNAAFTDRVTITAIANGILVDPTSLVPGAANILVSPNTVEGRTLSVPTSADGNLNVSFAQSGITEILIVYQNATNIPNPGFQNISIHDIHYSPVPLPGALVLLVSGLSGLLFARRC